MRKRILLVTIISVTLIFGINRFQSNSHRPIQRKQQILGKTSPDRSSPQVVYHGPRTRKEVALTFDADMTPSMQKRIKQGIVKSYYNKAVIDVLEKENVPATLFITGLWAKTYPEITNQLSRNPLFEIANHSYSHQAFSSPCFHLPRISQDQKEYEFKESQKVLKEVTDQTPRFFRFPGGCFTAKDVELAITNGLTPVQWDVESRDAFNNNTEGIVHYTLLHIRAGSIVVFHLNRDKNAPKTAEALPTIVNTLRNQGFTFVKVSQITKD